MRVHDCGPVTWVGRLQTSAFDQRTGQQGEFVTAGRTEAMVSGSLDSRSPCTPDRLASRACKAAVHCPADHVLSRCQEARRADEKLRGD